ncbi:hypothetical protein [Marinibactrum halimedae]|uniref:hypothetical protein n=1 Tax=Marinibactrum halimedae TaxID=1444977 RepID=UPI001E3BD7CF|nr:hypothetical protein [Marinibactrum halimedae]MCD9460505.1 hypothetical protein [Marinibactrum halimedae]
MISALNVNALESLEGKVTLLEPTQLPKALNFQLDVGNARCPEKTWLKWSNENAENNMAIYNTMLAAFVTGSTVRVYLSDGSECKGQYLHIIRDKK